MLTEQVELHKIATNHNITIEKKKKQTNHNNKKTTGISSLLPQL